MMYQTPVTIEHTLRKIERHDIVLPAIQREFVWQPEQICTLFDSLMQGYPFGTFLYWKVDQENNKNYQFYDFIRDYHEKDNPHCPRLGELPNRDVTAVLDGQQRLTALNIGLRGSLANKLPWKRRSNPDAYPQKHLYVDLLWAPDDQDDVGVTFLFEFRSPAEIENGRSCWFAIKDIMRLADSGPAMTEWLENRLPGVPIAPAHRVLHRLYTVIRERPLVCFYEEPSQELKKVLQIFIRTNSGGTVLSYSDLLLSVAVAQWSEYDAREEIHQLVDDLNNIGHGFTLSKDWVLKAGLMLADIGSVGFKVENFNRDNMETLESRWPRIKRALVITIELASNFGFKAETLGADSALLPIAYYLYVTGADNGHLTKSSFASDRSNIRKWLVCGLLKTGIWGSGLDSLLTALRQVIRNKHDHGFPVAELHVAMSARGKSLAFTDEEVDELTEMRYGDKRTFSLLSLVFTHLDLRHHFHIDHFFPKSRFTPARLRSEGLSEKEASALREMADCLPNLQLLGGVENQEKRSRLPAAWLATFESDDKRVEYSAMHLLGDVPTDLSRFSSFYSARKKRLKSKIRDFLG